ncbi:LppU/SCO3897 family protein [Kibdelosporangium aridum]|uniref:LppU/SCO3897 family protein n=1 Tax=Kibdelosporangium aridum TaxID=2030 RepID=UPI0005253D4F
MSSDVSTPPPAPQQPGQQPQPEPKRKKGLPRWLISIIALIVIGGGVYAYNYFTNDAVQAKAGDCAKITGAKDKPEYASVACDSGTATHVVGKALSNTSDTCADPYISYTMTASRGPDAKLCLVPKMEEGACYKEDKNAATDFVKTDCGAADDETLKVTKIVNGAGDAACGEAAPITFPEPPTTLCFAPAKAQQ